MSLKGCNLAIEKHGTQMFIGARANGLSGLMLAYLAHGTDLRGATLICSDLGLATARLAIIAGIKTFRVDCISRKAWLFLEDSAAIIDYNDISQDLSQIEIDLEIICASYGDPIEFVRAIKSRILGAIEHNVFPNDGSLIINMQPRLGFGGGGT
jgi:hypothetical protein